MSKELEHVEEQLKRIDRETQSLKDQLNNLVDQGIKYRLRWVELVYKVRVGSIVRDRKGVEHQVTRVETRWGNQKPWLEGNPKRKDGTFGTAHRNLYDDWTVVERDE